MKIIGELLRLEHCPNEAPSVLSVWSPWACFVQRTCRKGSKDDFIMATESGLFSLFIQSGAERDSRVDNCPETKNDSCGIRFLILRACSSFVQAIFSHASNSEHKNKLLRTLDDFFELGDRLRESPEQEIHSQLFSVFRIEIKKIDPRKNKTGETQILRKNYKEGCPLWMFAGLGTGLLTS